MPHQGKTIRSLLAASIISLAGAGAHAETFPAKPVRILVPYAAGLPAYSSSKILATAFAQAPWNTASKLG